MINLLHDNVKVIHFSFFCHGNNKLLCISECISQYKSSWTAQSPDPRLDPLRAQTSSCRSRLVLALAFPTSSPSDSSSSPIPPSESRPSCDFDTWQILASPLKQLLITGSRSVVATTSLPGFSVAESRPAFIQTCSLGELWPHSDPIAQNLFLCQDPPPQTHTHGHTHLHPISACPAVDFIIACLCSKASTNSIKLKYEVVTTVWLTSCQSVCWLVLSTFSFSPWLEAHHQTMPLKMWSCDICFYRKSPMIWC